MKTNTDTATAKTIQIDHTLGHPSIGERVKTYDGLTGEILRVSASGTGRRVVRCDGDGKERVYDRKDLTKLGPIAATLTAAKKGPTLAEIVKLYGETEVAGCQEAIDRFAKIAAINPARAVEDSRPAIIGAELKYRIERLLAHAAAADTTEAVLLERLVDASNEAADELLRWSTSRSTCQFTNAVDLCKFDAVREWGKLTQRMFREFDKTIARRFSSL